MVAVYRMAPQATLLEQSLAMGHRHPTGSTTRAPRAWSPSVPAGRLQETTPGEWPAVDHPPVHRASKNSDADPRGDFLLFESEGFYVSVLALMASDGFLPVSRVTSLFRAATTEGNHFTHSVERSPEDSRISWAYLCPKSVHPASGSSALRCLDPCGCQPDPAEPGQSASPASD